MFDLMRMMTMVSYLYENARRVAIMAVSAWASHDDDHDGGSDGDDHDVGASRRNSVH